MKRGENYLSEILGNRCWELVAADKNKNVVELSVQNVQKSGYLKINQEIIGLRC